MSGESRYSSQNPNKSKTSRNSRGITEIKQHSETSRRDSANPAPQSKHNHHRHSNERKDSNNATGKNETGDCFCQPCWCFCCNRICKVTTAVQLVAWFDGIVNFFLMVFAVFAIMLWRAHGKYVEERGFSPKNPEWAAVMEPNEDGIIMLIFSYLMVWPFGFWLAFNYSKRNRLEPIAWCIAVTYATCLQIASYIYFPFTACLINVPLWLFRVYQYWIICHYDYLLRNRPTNLRTNAQIETWINGAEGGGGS